MPSAAAASHLGGVNSSGNQPPPELDATLGYGSVERGISSISYSDHLLITNPFDDNKKLQTNQYRSQLYNRADEQAAALRAAGTESRRR